jgi:hypothetical protein
MLPFTADITSKYKVLYIMFADLYHLIAGKSCFRGLPVADAACPRVVLFR